MSTNRSTPPSDGRGRRTAGITGEVWLREQRRHRDSLPLTVDRITAMAITLLDAEGVGRLTMRRLAEALDVGPATLYWHVKTKEDVLDLAVDSIFGEVSLPVPSGRWEEDVRSLVAQWRDAMLRHPWSPALVGRPMLGPNVLTRTEFLKASLSGAGFDGPVLAAATHGLANYVIGSAVTQSTWQRQDNADLQQSASAHLQEHADAYPTLAATNHLGDQDWGDLFERGLHYFLAGLTQSMRPMPA